MTMTKRNQEAEVGLKLADFVADSLASALPVALRWLTTRGPLIGRLRSRFAG
jgi:hypothetical protein